jgi:hypothetical protein
MASMAQFFVICGVAFLFVLLVPVALYVAQRSDRAAAHAT